VENLQNNPWFLLGIAVLLAVGIIYFGWAVWPNITELNAKISTLNDDIAALRKEVEEGRALQARLPELQREIKAKEEELEQLKKILPPDPEVEMLVRKLERLAVDSRLFIKNWTSGKKIQQEFYWEWPIAVSASSSYHNLAKFYAMLGNYARIINVANLRITRSRSRKAEDADKTIQVNFTATTYVYREEAK
jgi:type IV pilus assembly protein PilO